MDAFDLVIKNGSLVDPESGTIRVGHVGVKDGKIASLTTQDIHGAKEIDAGLELVCPGFVDMHAHVDRYLYSAQCMVRQEMQGMG